MNEVPASSNGRALVHEVIDRIREHIVSNALKPGDRLPTEREICTLFGVGRSTVREALTVLEVLGAVTRKTKVGTVVSEVDFSVVASIIRFLVVRSQKDLVDLFEARRIFEVHMLPMVWDNWSEATHDLLNQAVDRYAQAIREGRDGVIEDVQFHEALVECSKNVFVRHYAAMIREFFDVPQVTVPLTEEQKQLTLQEHSQVVDLLASGDVLQAQRVLHRHLSRYVERGIVPPSHRP